MTLPDLRELLPEKPDKPPAKEPDRRIRRGRRTRQRVYQFIRQYKDEHFGNSPSVREIAEACDISSTSVVAHTLDMLARQGVIQLGGDRQTRTIYLRGESYTPPPAQVFVR